MTGSQPHEYTQGLLQSPLSSSYPVNTLNAEPVDSNLQMNPGPSQWSLGPQNAYLTITLPSECVVWAQEPECCTICEDL